MSISRLSYLYFLLLIPILLVDSINGALLLKGIPIPISSVYKLLLLIVIVTTIVRRELFWCVLILIISMILYYTVSYNSDPFVEFSYVSKTLYFILCYIFTFTVRYSLNIKHYILLKRAVFVSVVVLSVNIYLGVAGFGFSTYGASSVAEGQGFGIKGYFFAGNELGAILVALYPLVVVIFAKNIFKLVIINLNFIIIAGLIGTKTAFLGIFILSLYSIFKNNEGGKIKWAFVFVTLILVLLYVHEAILTYIEPRLGTLTFYLNDRGLLFLILSGRNLFFNNIMDFYLANATIGDLLLGFGQAYSVDNFKSAEMDFPDLFVRYGFVFTSIIYTTLGVYVFKVLNLVGSSEKNIFIVTFFVLFGISNIAGHVLTSAMFVPIFSIYYPVLLLRGKYECSNA
ncbi:O-antigen ligase family protein [Vibrio cyclitrophicus]